MTVPPRRVLPALLGALAVAGVAALPAAAADLLTDPAARLYTVAGAPGATLFPSASQPATARQVATGALAALPGGDLVFADTHGRTDKLWRIDARGILRELLGGRGASVVTVAGDGTVYAGLANTHRIVRLSADGTTTTPVADLAAQAPRYNPGLVALSPLPGGALAVADDRGIFRVSADGTATRLSPPATANVSAMAASTDGSIYYFQGNNDAVYRIPPGGGEAARVTTTDPGTTLLAPLADGRMLLSTGGSLEAPSGRFEILAADGTRTTIGGATPRFGNGDGGPLAAVAGRPDALTTTPDGGLAFHDSGLFGGPGHLRRLLPATTTQAAAAFAQAAYTDARTGRTTVLTTVPGTVTVQVRSVATGKLVRTAAATVPVGTTTLSFPSALPPTDLTETLVFVPAGDATRIRAQITVSTRRSLTMARVRKALDRRLSQEGGGDEEAGYGSEAGTCRRRTALRVDCLVLDYQETYHPHRKTTTCRGQVLVRQRADGITLRFVDGCKL